MVSSLCGHIHIHINGVSSSSQLEGCHRAPSIIHLLAYLGEHRSMQVALQYVPLTLCSMMILNEEVYISLDGAAVRHIHTCSMMILNQCVMNPR